MFQNCTKKETFDALLIFDERSAFTSVIVVLVDAKRGITPEDAHLVSITA
jgi:hypothetical protein